MVWSWGWHLELSSFHPTVDMEEGALGEIAQFVFQICTVCFGDHAAFKLCGKGICWSVQGGFNAGHVLARE